MDKVTRTKTFDTASIKNFEKPEEPMGVTFVDITSFYRIKWQNFGGRGISFTELMYGQGLCAKCGQHADFYPGGKRLRTHRGSKGEVCRHRKFVKPVGILPTRKEE